MMQSAKRMSMHHVMGSLTLILCTMGMLFALGRHKLIESAPSVTPIAYVANTGNWVECVWIPSDLCTKTWSQVLAESQHMLYTDPPWFCNHPNGEYSDEHLQGLFGAWSNCRLGGGGVLPPFLPPNVAEFDGSIYPIGLQAPPSRPAEPLPAPVDYFPPMFPPGWQPAAERPIGPIKLIPDMFPPGWEPPVERQIEGQFFAPNMLPPGTEPAGERELEPHQGPDMFPPGWSSPEPPAHAPLWSLPPMFPPGWNPSRDYDRPCTPRPLIRNVFPDDVVVVGVGGMPFSHDPVNLIFGHKREAGIDILVPITGGSFHITRDYSSNPDLGGSMLVGTNWSLNVFRFLHRDDPQSITSPLSIHDISTGVRTFYHDGTDKWTLTSGSDQYLMKSHRDIGNDRWPVYRLIQPGSWTMEFYRTNESGETGSVGGGVSWMTTPATHAGLLLQQRSAYGHAHTYSYMVLHEGTGDPDTAAARLSAIYLNGTSDSDCDASLHFEWHQLNTEALGRLNRIEVIRYPVGGDPTTVETVEYTYKRSDDELSDDLGAPGTLIQVAKSVMVDRAPSGTPPWHVMVQQYRYHTSTTGELSGQPEQLKMILRAEQIEYAAQQHYDMSSTGTVLGYAAMLLGLDDAEEAFGCAPDATLVAHLASNTLGYQSENDGGRVTVQFVQSGCGCGESKPIRIEYDYLDYSELVDPEYSSSTILTFSYWDALSEEYEPYVAEFYDFEAKSIESPETPPTTWTQQYLRTIARAELGGTSSRVWAQHLKYNSQRLISHLFKPSAVSGYTPGSSTTEPEITLRTDDGVVLEYTYTTALKPQDTIVGRGESGPRSLMRSMIYEDSARPWLVTKIQVSDVSEATAIPSDPLERRTVEYNYGFHSSTGAIAWVETVIHAEASVENGIVDAELYYHSFFSETGQAVWSRSADGTLTRVEYDSPTGRMTLIEVNAAPDSTLPDCNGCSFTGSFDGRHGDGGSLTFSFGYNLIGRRQSVTAPSGAMARVSHELRPFKDSEDRYHDDRPGIMYFAQVALPDTYTESTETTFAAPALVTWYTAHQRPIATVQYLMSEGGSNDYGDIFPDYEHSFSSASDVSRYTATHALSGATTSTTAWHSLTGEGDNDGFLVTHYKYDAIGRLEDIIAPNGSLTRYIRDGLGRVIEVHQGIDGTTPLPISRLEYDHGDAGDGNVTSVEIYTGESAPGDVRTTQMHYDWRNRLIAIENADAPHVVIEYDNMSRPKRFAIFSALPSDLEDMDDAQSLTDRGVYGEIEYNRRGLPFRSRVAIDASNLSAGFLESDSWYDEAGRLVSQTSPNSPASTIVYNALGQVGAVFAVAAGGNPVDLADDVVFEQAEFSYQEDTGRLQLITTKVRTHDADESLTGDLSTWSGSDAAKVITTYSGVEYDPIGRVTRSIEFGTNSSSGFASGGAAPQLDTNTPPRWQTTGDEIAVEVLYNARGLIDRIIDPLDRETSVWYDDLGRRIAVVENHVSSQLAIAWDDQANRWAVSGNSSSALDQDRVTSFVYRTTQNIMEQVAHTFDGSSAAVQVTQHVYGVVAGTNADDSRITSNDLLREIRYPDRDTGLPTTATENRVRFAYNRLGEVRYTQDQNDTSHTYVRDIMGRVVQDIAEIAQGSPIDDTIDQIRVTYDNFSRPSVVESLSGNTVMNAVQTTYTSLGQIEEIYQAHFGAVNGSTPKVVYGYDTHNASSGNFSRAVSLTYPTTSAVLEAVYNTADSSDPPSVDHAIGRLRSLEFGGRTIAAYDFVGLAMSAVVSYPHPDVELNFWLAHNATGTTGQYPGFDRFGRTVRHKWVDGNYADPNQGGGPHGTHGTLPKMPSIVELAYTYDKSSNIIEKYDARPGAKRALNHKYVYDGLSRLVEAKRGSGHGGGFTTASGGQEWSLDLLGNHIAFNTDLNGDGQYNASHDRMLAGEYNFVNEVVELTRTEAGGSPVALPFAYDDAGNLKEKELTGSMSLRFTHDAWNRLVKVERPSDDPLPVTSHVTLAEYEYNGLHQRILKRVDTSAPGTGGYGTLDEQRMFYYSAGWQILEELIDDDLQPTTPFAVTETVEYCWGIRHIDDIMFQRRTIHGSPPVVSGLYHLTDHQFSTVALLDNAANLVERVTYDAYGMARHHWKGDITGDGAVDSADRSLALAAHNTSIGDSAYNVDADMSRTGTVETGDLHWFGTSQFKAALPKGDLSARSIGNTIGYCGYVFNPEVPSTNGGGGFYTVRFRHYDAEFGRWLERDPLGYVDGMNLYEYVQGNAVNAFDPFGLCVEWDIHTPPQEKEPVESPVPPSSRPPGGSSPQNIDRGSAWDPLQEFLEDRSQAATGMRETLEEIGGVLRAVAIEAALWFVPGGKIIQVTGNVVKVLKGKKVYTYIITPRKAPGRDGAQSLIIKEQVDGKTISVIHQVIKDGKVIHQHQTHVGKYGTMRQFPDEWVEYPMINP